MASVAEICTNALLAVGDRQPINNLQTDQTQEALVCNARFGMAVDTLAAEHDWSFATKRTILALVAAPYAAWSGATTYAQGQNVTLAGATGFFTSQQNGNLNNPPSTSGTAFWSYTPYYTRTGWNYMYAVPQDCVKVQGVQFQPNLGIDGPFIDNPPQPPPQSMRQPLADMKAEWKVEGDDGVDGNSVILSNYFPGTAELKYTANLRTLGVYPAAFSEALMWLLATHLAIALPNKAEYAKLADAKFKERLFWAIARDLNGSEQLAEAESPFTAVRGGNSPIGGMGF